MALAAAPLVPANNGSVSGPRGDLWAEPSGGGGSLDMVSASYGHTKKGRLVHTVTLAGGAANPASGGNVPYLIIEDPVLSNGTAECRYFVGRHDGQLGVFTCGYGDRVASARISRTSSNTIRYEFSPSAIESPTAYDWAVVTKGAVSGTQADVDRLPDGDDNYLRHKLR